MTIIFHLLIMVTQIFKTLGFIALFIFDVFLLGIPAEYAALALGGALGGGMVLSYMKPTKFWVERLIKIVLSATSAIFIAPAFIHYYNITSKEYIALIFFIISMLSLFILRALINLTEQNATSVIKQVFIRVLNIQTIEEKRNKNSILPREDIK
jgi:hypothetical protein